MACRQGFEEETPREVGGGPLSASIDWNYVLNKLLVKYRTIPVPAKAAMWFAVCSVVTNCISMLTMPLFTRLMSTDQYGVQHL